MQRYFFDVKTDTHVQYDYCGKTLGSLDQARQLAELIAMDVGCTWLESTAREVQTRDAAGKHLFSVPVKPVDTLAA